MCFGVGGFHVGSVHGFLAQKGEEAITKEERQDLQRLASDGWLEEEEIAALRERGVEVLP